MRQAALNDKALDKLQRGTFGYFLKETKAENGLVPDNTRDGAPCSITAVGLALAAYTVGVERGYLTRDEAVTRTLTTPRFFWNGTQGEESDALGYKGFYYHFLNMQTGRRMWKSELSTIDTTFLLAGALAAAQYFNRETKEEREIRTLASALYRRADWQWALNGGAKVSMGWKPESGFLRYRWEGYSEALLLYALGLGSPARGIRGRLVGVSRVNSGADCAGVRRVVDGRTAIPYVLSTVTTCSTNGRRRIGMTRSAR